MSRRYLMTRMLAMGAMMLLAPTFGEAQINIGINIGTPPPPPPPIVVSTPPQLVVIPGTQVYHAPNVPHNYFVHGGKYYVVHEGTWYVAPAYHGPWTLIPVERVPGHVRRVPVAYYKIPPGQLKKYGGEHPGKGHRKHKHKHDDEDED